MKTKKLLISILFALLSAGAFAQGENNVWTMGYGLGLNFNTAGGPSFYSNSINAWEGCAAVSDNGGNLLFFSDGLKVYDRTHTVMPNGSGLLGHISTTQGVAIAKVPSYDSLYYLFTLTEAFPFGTLRYSIIDLRLNGGLGDVDMAFKNIFIKDSLSEKMTLTGNCEKQWLLLHHKDSSYFYAFSINSSKTMPSPVVSKTGFVKNINTYAVGELKVSHDRKTIACATFSNNYGLDLYDFDNATGIVSNYRVLDSSLSKYTYGVAFSPDDSKMYLGCYRGIGAGILQYDLSAGGTAAIAASKYTVTSGPTTGLRTGPDGMVYVVLGDRPTNFSRIRSPNLAGSLCNFQLNFLTSSFINTQYCLGFGNHFIIERDTTYSTKITKEICSGSTAIISASRFNKHYWNDGDTAASKTVSHKPGTYWVKSFKNCYVHIDTFEIVELPVEMKYSKTDTFSCATKSLVLKSRPGADSAKWSDGSTSIERVFSVSVSKLWVHSFNKCSGFVDTFNITFKPTVSLNEIIDTSICFKSSVKIAAPNTFQTYLWNGGNTGFDTTLYTDGRVIVVAKDTIHCTILKQDYTVSFVNFSSNIPDTSTCNEDTIILDATIPNPEARYRWNIGDTTAKLKVTTGSRYVFITVNGCTLIDSVNIKQFPMKVSIGEDTSLCKGTKTILKADVDNVSYKWSTGATSQSIEVSESGNYGVTIFKDACSGKSEIKISFVNCDNCTAFPTGFTPNNDGINDYFKPILNCPPVSYQLKIMNRWGQEVFYSNNANDKWDGTSNGNALDGGVYFFMLKVKFEAQNDEEKMLKGEITLVR